MEFGEIRGAVESSDARMRFAYMYEVRSESLYLAKTRNSMIDHHPGKKRRPQCNSCDCELRHVPVKSLVTRDTSHRKTFIISSSLPVEPLPPGPQLPQCVSFDKDLTVQNTWGRSL